MNEFYIVLPIILLLSTIVCPFGMYSAEKIGPKV